ncbi:unknown similar to AMEV089 [Mythimna separata entomopoxvirus 'L']|uniref:Uncharacterized protein n=1 Tax=Mythimna separata entomopoxvirus 'L' TaxID=1293572 RepID=A0A916KQC9_9POXV|nr:unknown similar to AMEV089 [Mythimna separata entomopoxvirus 'L']CCU56310.1 unknown similar to AMEV089 [Mythimna separata entomopoxvirus 'L']
MKNILSTYVLLNFMLLNHSFASATDNTTTYIDYDKLFTNLDPLSLNLKYAFYIMVSISVSIIALCMAFFTFLLIYYIYDNKKAKIIKTSMGMHA